MAELSNDTSAGKRAMDAGMVERWGDALLAWARGVMTVERFEASETFFEKVGHYALMLSVILGFLFGTVCAIKSNVMATFSKGLLWVPIVLVLQYTAAKFLSVSRSLIKSSPSQLASESFLSCTAILNLVFGVAALAGLSYSAIKDANLGAFLLGVVFFVLCELLVCLCLNPSTLNISVIPATGAGQEAVGVLTFFMKGLMRLVPIAFGIGSASGVVMIVIAFIQVFRGQSFPELESAGPAGSVILFSASLPLASYLAFILYYLAIDISRAILSLPEKLDALRK